jgi:hypothetical protein
MSRSLTDAKFCIFMQHHKMWGLGLVIGPGKEVNCHQLVTFARVHPLLRERNLHRFGSVVAYFRSWPKISASSTLASRSLRFNLVLAQDSGDVSRRRYPIFSLLPYEAGRVHFEEPYGEVAPAILNGALEQRHRLSVSPPATRGSSTGSLELPLVVVDPVARVYPVIIVPTRMRGTEASSVQPADRGV